MTRSQSVIVEDLFLTDTFLIKGRLANKSSRLAKMLEDTSAGFLQVEDAAMISLRASEVIHTPRVLINPKELILAHELVDVAGDTTFRQLAANDKTTRIRAFYNGVVQLELSGRIEEKAYLPQERGGRQYFTMEKPVLRGLRFETNADLEILKDLGYAIIRKDKLAYVYDFS